MQKRAVRSRLVGLRPPGAPLLLARLGLARRGSLIGVTLLFAACAFSASCETANRVKSKVVAITLMMDIGDPFELAPRQTEIATNLMSISGPVDQPEAVPLTGADVILEIEGVSGIIQMNEEGGGGGVYVAHSGSGTPTFVYTSNASYTVTMDVSSGKFKGDYDMRVTAPARTNVTGLPNTQGGATIPAGQSLTVTLTGSYDRGVVLVLDSQGDLTYDNRPTDVQTAIDFVFSDFEGEIVIPGSAFQSPNALYGLVIVGLESAPSGGISSNLNILSKFYAGSAKTAVVRTAP